MLCVSALDMVEYLPPKNRKYLCLSEVFLFNGFLLLFVQVAHVLYLLMLFAEQISLVLLLVIRCAVQPFNVVHFRA